MIKATSLLLATCAVGLCSAQSHLPSFSLANAERPTPNNHQDYVLGAPTEIMAGEYLASRHAQIHHDWSIASNYLDQIIHAGIAPDEIMQRSMVLSIGAEKMERAIKLAHITKEKSPAGHNIVADILIFVESVKKEDYKNAEAILKAMPDDNTVAFISPFLNGWVQAAQGKSAVKSLQNNTAQLYHAILIADYLNDHSDIEAIIDRAMNVEDITSIELERIADLYGHVGLKDKATSLYQKAIASSLDKESLENKIDALQHGTNDPLFEKLKSPRHGVSQAFHDIAQILIREANDETAEVFAQIAYYLAPDLTDTLITLAEISQKNNHLDKAVAYYSRIPKSDENYIEAQYDIVDLYRDNEQFDKAVEVLSALSPQELNADTLIKLGDLHRAQSNFGLALQAYDQAVEKLGGEIPEDYWHLHYVRGISYEQANNWKQAEIELQAALKYQPDHPYVLNYLGYAWADKGIHLDKAKQMIQRAVDLRPSDGYITDSLGWVLFKTKEYKQAVNVLERAVELMPYDPTVNDHLGDAYWKVGRRLEARFQWERAKNHSEDQEQIKVIEAKLESGITEQ